MCLSIRKRSIRARRRFLKPVRKVTGHVPRWRNLETGLVREFYVPPKRGQWVRAEPRYSDV